MPINVTWTSPSDLAIGYILYKRQGNGPINTQTDFYQNLPSTPLAFDDSTYDRTVLQELGYTYGITALGPSGETELSNVQFVQVNFDTPLFTEIWNLGFTTSEVVEFVEQWEYALALTPSQLYLEDWDVTISGPGLLSYDEDWEPKEFSNPGALQYDEDWENKEFTNPGVAQYDEDWEFVATIFTPSFAEPWDFPASPSFNISFDEPWELPPPPNFTLSFDEDWES